MFLPPTVMFSGAIFKVKLSANNSLKQENSYTYWIAWTMTVNYSADALSDKLQF